VRGEQGHISSCFHINWPQSQSKQGHFSPWPGKLGLMVLNSPNKNIVKRLNIILSFFHISGTPKKILKHTTTKSAPKGSDYWYAENYIG
jgi:hypothetical protein